MPFLIGLSGPTSSGKTTIATALAAIFPPSLLKSIHADDFYKPDSLIPRHPTGVQDWDCADALDVIRFRSTLIDIKNGGQVPDQLVKQGGVEDGVHSSASISPEAIARMREDVQTWPQHVLEGRQIVLVEGFLLFGVNVREELGGPFDLRIILRTTRLAAQKRRESRSGYVTLEGFWQDPEGYFESVVWPNYVQEHEMYFVDGDVEGQVRDIGEEGNHLGIEIGPVGDVGLEELCEWVLGCLRRALEDDKDRMEKLA